MEYPSIFKKYSFRGYLVLSAILTECIILLGGIGCTPAVDLNTERRITTIDSLIPKKSEPFVVSTTFKFYEVGLIQDTSNAGKVDSYSDQWLYKPGSVKGIIDTSTSPITIWLDIALEGDSENPTRQRPRQEVVTSIRIRLDSMPASGTYPLSFPPNFGTGSLIITSGTVEPQKTHFGKAIVSFSPINKTADGKNSKLTMVVQATVPSASKSFPTFNFQGDVNFQW
ncbi:MAG: hypothetical protein JST20_01610 [Bacteroidetes bacterium]|nr:hypothetical protein [Bacteroidota bacterium]